jgi:RNA polymerase sigma factor (TIGR02999 family)
MHDQNQSEITRMLQRVESEGGASAELLPLVYEQLRRLAAARMAREAAGQTLQPTALVHEAWLRLIQGGEQHWRSRGHFFGAAALAMRRILIDRARQKMRAKRGGGVEPVAIDEVEIAEAMPDERILQVDAALERLKEAEPEMAHLVTLKFYGGLTDKEAAETLGITDRTVRNRWRYARAWLLEELRRGR